jgi:dihydroorotate dehydrogenase electron transfer subunit
MTPSQRTPSRQQFIANVVENVPLCREHFRLVLSLPSFPPTEPGQFVQLLCREPGDIDGVEDEAMWEEGQRFNVHGEELHGPVAMLRRPFSLAGRRNTSDGVELDIIHRVVGVGTQWLSKLRAGDEVSVLGPLGNHFELPRAGAMGILVGGGVGIPPMLYLGEKVAGRAIAFCGATSFDLLPLTVVGERVEEFARHGIPAVVTTDDGSYGVRGFVTQALERYLDENAVRDVVIYTCGPEAMMKRVAAIALSRGLACQVAAERAMACGMGTCQSCCIKVRDDGGWRYKLTCTDGPVFAAADLLW